MRHILISLLLCAAAAAQAQVIAPREGWVVLQTNKSHAELLDALRAAVRENGMGVVTQAGPTAAAARRGIKIPENRVVGVFNNDFALRVLSLSAAAMIEAPIRFYVTETAEGTAVLSYKTPTFVFRPYMEEAGPELAHIARDLDDRFAAVAAEAVR